jgi:hypothetical protein
LHSLMVRTLLLLHQERLAEKREQEAAAVKIQAVYRGSGVRRSIPDYGDDDEGEEGNGVAVVAAPLPPALRGPGADDHIRSLLHDAVANPTGRVRVSPYTMQTEIQMTKPPDGGFGVGVKESPVTGMMTVNRVAPGGVAEAAGVQEGFVLLKLGVHDLFEGEASFKAAQQAIAPHMPGPIAWLFSHPDEAQLEALDADGDGVRAFCQASQHAFKFAQFALFSSESICRAPV